MRKITALASLSLALTLVSCAGGTDSFLTGNDNDSTSSSTLPADENPKEVTLLAYDAFTPAEGIFDEFTRETGAAVKVVTGGDSGTVVNKAILTAGNPEGDVLWGIDNTTIARAEKARVLEGHVPVDEGDVCVNYSKSWYASQGLVPPTSLDDLIKPQYKGQLVIQDPVNSSPGLNFLLATIATYGDGWKQWWTSLKRNGVTIVPDWTTAWTVEYAGSGNPGTHPLVVSYGSSPPAEIIYAADPKNPPREPDSGVVTATCFRQTEYVGVLRGTKNPNIAAKLVNYLLAKNFQSSVPTSLFVWPVNKDAVVPEVFAKWAVRAESPITMTPDEVGAKVGGWLDEWRALVL